MSEERKRQVIGLLEEYADVFSNVPGKTNLAEHEIKLTSDKPVRSKSYPTPHNLQKEIDKEIDVMLENDIIERSDSAYAAPLVVVKKSDGSNRICCNYKQPNKLTIFDPEPMMAKEDVFNKLSGSQIYSKFNFCKDYWQIPMQEECKDMTTFVCNRGLYRFKVMPFGLVNSASSYNLEAHGWHKAIRVVRGRRTRTYQELGGTLEAVEDFLRKSKKGQINAEAEEVPDQTSVDFFLGHTVSNDRISQERRQLRKLSKCQGQ